MINNHENDFLIILAYFIHRRAGEAGKM